VKRFNLLLVLAGLAALLFAMPGTAVAGKPVEKATSGLKDTIKTQVRVISTGQGPVKSSGKLKVKVSVKASKKTPRDIKKTPVKIALRGSSKVVWSPRSNISLYGETLKLKPNHSKVVTMKLNPTGKSKVGDCGTPTFEVTASYRSGKKSKTAKTSRKLTPLKSLCDVPPGVDLANADKCDFIAAPGNTCLAPFPNDFYTKKDPSAETGKRLDLDPDSTPSNDVGKHIAVDVLNQSDGFSPGPLLAVRIPGMDNEAAFTESGIVSIKEMSRTFEPSQPVVLIDAANGERQLIWAELDSNATSDETRNLIIRPGKNLQNGHRYIVALRNLKDSTGAAIASPPGFRVYRDTDRTSNPTIENRRAHFESIFKTLGDAGIERKSLYLAWDFTVASTENLTGRMLSIRDRAFAGLGDTNLTDGVVQGDAPAFHIDKVTDCTGVTGGDCDEDIRVVEGTYTVPCYLDQDSCPSGSNFNLDADQKPIRIEGNTMQSRFVCNIPRTVVGNGDGTGDQTAFHQTARPSLYGHGLFGSIDEVTSKNIRQLGVENNVIVCGTDWIGMSEGDVIPTAFFALKDLSSFPDLPDRLQQGFLNFLFLGRLLIHPDGFAADNAFKIGGQSVLNTDDLFYYGNSQGGIAGGALTAVATDFTRSVLYVPGMNYSTLLTRSTDFNDYATVLYPSYPNEIDRPALFSLMQTMWDRGEPNGYANNMTSNPLPNTPAHKVMIEMSYGDHQVSNVTTEVEARTIGAPLRTPTIDEDRAAPGLIEPFYGHETLGDLAGSAANGNAYFVWDIGPQRMQEDPIGSGNMKLFGTDPAPLTNTPPTTGNSNTPLGTTSGIDPHDTVIRSSPIIRKQIADFLKTDGKVTNPCGLNPCYAAQWKGMP